MDIISAYREVGNCRGVAAICETTPKTVRRVIARHEAGGVGAERKPRESNYDAMTQVVIDKIAETKGRMSDNLCCRWRPRPATKAPGGTSADWSRARRPSGAAPTHHRGRRPAVWTPDERLVIDWGVLGGLHVFFLPQR